MSDSPLDAYSLAIQLWLDQGLTYKGIAEQIRLTFGVETTEASVRRAIGRNDLSKPTGASVGASDEDQALWDDSVVERAVRALDGLQTDEDRLRDELDVARAEIKRAEQVIKRYREKESFEDRIEKTIRQAITVKPYEPQFYTLSGVAMDGTASEYFLCLSDAHYGEVVNPDEALGIKYDTDIARRRIQHVRDEVAREKSEAINPIRKLTVGVLGDMLSGNIHHELAVTNEMVMVEQATEMAYILFNFAQDLCEWFPEVEFIIMPGNHPRTTQKPQFKKKYDNWEYVMGKMVEGMVGAAQMDTLTIQVPKDMTYVHEVFDYRIAMMHGDGIQSNSFAGIPFYGMRNRREAIQSLLSQVGQERVDLFVMGHFHQHLYWSGECDIIVNGSIKGGDEFGIGTRLSAPDPVQVLLEWHPDRGIVGQKHITLKHVT